MLKHKKHTYEGMGGRLCRVHMLLDEKGGCAVGWKNENTSTGVIGSLHEAHFGA